MSSRWLLALALATASCGCASSGRGPDFPTSFSFEDSPRRGPSFAPEPALETGLESPPPPDPQPAKPAEGTPAVAGEYIARDIQAGVVPLDSEAARDLVSRFFIAVLLESSRDLYPLLAAQAWAVSEGNRQPAATLWRARLAQLDYTSLSGRLVATPQTLRTYTLQSAAKAKQDGVPVPSRPDEVVVVATPTLSWTGKTRLFGEQLVFRLRPKQDQPAYEIAEIVEDFRLP